MGKAKNTVKTEAGAEVYTHNIFAYADEYIEEVRGGDDEGMADYFPDMIYYISDRIPKPSNDDIELLDTIFSLYTRLCARYRVLPTLECFSWLVDIDCNTFSAWIKGEYRASSAHSLTAKKWKDKCRSSVVNRLTNKGGTDANLIFIAKAAYGMAETAPVQITPQKRVLTASELPRLADNEQNDTINVTENQDLTENRIKEQ